MAPQPSTPGLVINGTPVAVTAGGAGLVPYPTVQGAQLNFVEVLNSSAFTIIVTQGLVLGQVPAFTAQVFPLLGTAQPLGWSALVPTGVIIPGQDSTIYFTWSEVPPYGQWPSAIGSSSVPFSSAVITFPSPSAGPASVASTNWLGIGNGTGETSPAIFALGYQGLVLTVQAVTPLNVLPGGASGAYRVIVEWAQDQAFTNIIGRRQFVVPIGISQGALNPSKYGGATMATPHFGDWVRFTTLGGPLSGGYSFVNFTAEQRVLPLSYWGPPPSTNLLGGGADTFGAGTILIPAATNGALGPAATFTVLSEWPYEGLVTPGLRMNFGPALNDWTLILSWIDEAGATGRIGTWTCVPASLSGFTPDPVTVPAAGLSLAVTNNAAAAHSFTLSLTADYSRIAA